MKYTYFPLIAFFLFFFSGCKKDDSPFSIISNEHLSGKVEGFNSDSINYIIASVPSNLFDYYIVGADSAETDNFDIDLTFPPEAYLSKLVTDSSLILSDTTVRMASISITTYTTYELGLYGPIVNTGSLERLNNPNIYLTGAIQKGNAFANFLYVSKEVKLSGQWSVQIGKTNWICKGNITLNEGWNELIYVSGSVSSSTIVWNVKVNDEPSGMKWYYVGNEPINLNKNSQFGILKLMQSFLTFQR
jgi:hypothetical protein